ncbi:4-hydroxy-tetrahydrodipicolinate reductase [Fodinicurvata sp. EGI_FJ10296]|uniref:4-hydroxy-tetrahydrodipicolinate reductase n=1 Tax=Fodinicurvata sp. EGI_FJ10296 TaxID=3231908 RepID=UPI0034550112
MKIGVVGAAGRMGRMNIAAVLATECVELAGAVARSGSDAVGTDAGLLAGTSACGVPVTDDAVALFAEADVVIDFTVPEATRAFAELAAQGKTAHVIGTTGLSAEDHAALDMAARHTPLMIGANMSMGVNLLAALSQRVAAILDEDFDIEIVEMHHRHKIDAPSGTALLLGQSAADGRGVNLDDRADRGRDGHTGERRPGNIGFASLRGGDVVGDHTVIFAGPGERVELGHKSSDRRIFARGAIKAARWLVGRKPGIYGMADVLGLRDL